MRSALITEEEEKEKQPLFQMSAILKFDFQKRKELRIFKSKLSKLHKKDPILHVTTTFPLKHRETRKNRAPIPHPLMCIKVKSQSYHPPVLIYTTSYHFM